MRNLFSIFFVFLLFVCSCDGSKSAEDKNALVKVGDRVLLYQEVEASLPAGLSSADSLLYAESFIHKWIKNELVYKVAADNLEKEDKGEIEKLVDEYKRSLIRYKYQDYLIRERLSAELQESDKKNYYQQNLDKFKLQYPIIKGLFLKIPIDAPGIEEIKHCYTSQSEDAIQKIEKYSVQNAAIYEYFYDRWVNFDEIIENVPVRVINMNDFLKTHKFVEVSDSTFCYLLNIKEYLPIGDISPYEYASSKVTEMLLTQKKVDFFQRFEDELYKEGIKNGFIKYNKKP